MYDITDGIMLYKLHPVVLTKFNNHDIILKLPAKILDKAGFFINKNIYEKLNT